MSAFSAPTVNPNLDSSDLEQLKAEAIALEGSKKHEEALAKYEEVLVIQQRDLPVGHSDTHETLTSIDRAIDQLKYASIDNFDVHASAHSLYVRGQFKDAYSLWEQTFDRLMLTKGEDHPDTLITLFNMANALCNQKRFDECRAIFEQVLEKRTRLLPLDDPLTLTAIVSLAGALCELERYDESLKMYEEVVPKLIRVRGEDENDTLSAIVSMAHVQFNMRRFDDSKQTSTTGLLLARRVGNERLVALFVSRLSKLEEVEKNKVFAATASDEQKEVLDKINQRKWAKAKAAADEAALLATRAKATTESDLDALMAQFGFEEGDDCSGGKVEKKQSGGGGKKKKKGR
jgi:tetratricopeptide (TPR) repeat protein